MIRVGETAELIIGLGGNVRMIYSELIEPHALGDPKIERGSHVEPDQNGLWWADLSPSNGPKLGPFLMRSRAIEAEIAWLREFWLEPAPEQASRTKVHFTDNYAQVQHLGIFRFRMGCLPCEDMPFRSLTPNLSKR